MNKRRTRARFFILMCIAAPILIAAQPKEAPAAKKQQLDPLHNGQHDFDFEIGTWNTDLKVLANPFTDSATWVPFKGTTRVIKILNGNANLVELEATGPKGHLQAISLRLYNPQTRQWNLNFATMQSGTLSVPSIGSFINGRGEFYNQETVAGRAVLVRFIILPITKDSCRFEQSYSADGGKTWDLNWIAIDTRLKEPVQ